MLLRVGLTGGIASGKSNVLKFMKAFGCRTIDADDIVHALYHPGSGIYSRLVDIFSEDILDVRRRIDRRKLGKIIFSDEEERKCLSDIVHPAVLAEEEKRLERLALEDPEGIAVIDAALMIEAGSFIRYHKVVVVVADQDIRLERLMRRDACTQEEALQKIQAQMPDREKRKFGDYVIENNGSLKALERKTREVHTRLVRDQQKLRGDHV